MGTVTNIDQHPRYRRKIPMEITYTYNWSFLDTPPAAPQPDPKRVNFLRVGRSEEEYQELMQRYAEGRELDNE